MPTDNRERLGLLEVCRLQRRHAAAAQLYADAFTADPQLADDLNAGHRYSAACSAALAAAGQGTDAGQRDDQTHSRLRQQALAWLRADLDAWNRLLDQGSDQARVARVTKALQPWMVDIDLARVRGPDALALLPQAERPGWQKFWQDVAALRQRAQQQQTLLEPVRVGQALDLVGPTVEGKTFDLKLLRGKVVLIDFWATWCGPCVAEMPNVKGVYDRYHQDGFEVVGVSLDNSRGALLQFLKAKGISWPQLFDEDSRAQGWKNPLVRKYGIHAIPATILVNRAGVVAAVRVRGEALEPAVARLLGKTPASPTAVASAVPAGQAPSFFRVTAVSLQAEPKEGPAPVCIVFRGKITTNGPGTVRYTFLRSDNARGPVFTLTFDKARVKEVSASWQLGGPSSSYAGWQALKVLAPNEVISENARFKIEPSK
jgi:thiol-disulfide isomerase/thioredoxin